jgi:hypothetical protein
VNDVIVRARRDYDRERTAVMRHTQMCGYCLDGPCPMGRAVRENAEAYGRHLTMLAHDAAREAGVGWA